MPLIKPPDEYQVYIQPADIIPSAKSDRPQAWFDWFFAVENWKCPECSAVMFGRSTFCAYCKGKLKKHTPRPSDYKEGAPYNDTR